ncbi:MAG TPA: glycoside hydrolase family 30 beta sandwich domain-containing protein [Vicinamibacteria bacterium]|nr:glycoside hydrolase family 30 beta sandwich domain-containing protein [Vicinamibacteria bacterium]
MRDRQWQPPAPTNGRRELMKRTLGLLGGSAFAALLPRTARAAPAEEVEWLVTTRSAPWQKRAAPVTSGQVPDVVVQTDAPLQAIDGFGACFNELGWAALAALAPADREAVLRELFAPGVGAGFTLCRMPIGANDFSRDWYSYDETDGDFALEHFTIAHDLEALVPFVKAAQRQQPALRLWASPWSPPTWMKRNRHYAMAMPGPWQPGVQNGLRADQVGREGTDMFVMEDRYLRAYASYFGRFVDEYRKQGIGVGMVMPQNEFNSAQVFPSCCWTAAGLARFISYLGPEMAKRGVAVFFGTLERANEGLLEPSLQDPAVAAHVKGVGLQWAGKGAIAGVHRRYPGLVLYQTEQECGDGRNDWRYCRYAWTLMKHYLRSGASAYLYWNIALREGGLSRWGWAQNSLVTVDPQARSYAYTHEYYLMKHLSAFVRPGARCLEAVSWSGYDNQLAFANPDGSVVVLIQNDMSEPLPVRIGVAGTVVSPTLPADSFSTLVVRRRG